MENGLEETQEFRALASSVLTFMRCAKMSNKFTTVIF